MTILHFNPSRIPVLTCSLHIRLDEVSAQLASRDREKTATTEELQKSERALIEGEAERKVLEQRIELLRDSLSEAQNERNSLQEQTNRLTRSLQVCFVVKITVFVETV